MTSTFTRALVLCAAAATLASPLLAQAARPSKDGPLPIFTTERFPYSAPAVGTKFVYTTFENVITKNDGFKTYYTDGQGQKGMRWGTFITDNPAKPGEITDAGLKALWPLRPGTIVDLPITRGEEKLVWRFAVQDTETVVVPAGKFRTVRIDGTAATVVTRRDPVVAMTTFWYAPSISAVVRLKFVPVAGPNKGRPVRNELVRIEKP